MNRNLYSKIAILAVATAVVMSSCISNKYRIKELDKGIQIAPNGINIPLGYIESKTLGEIINIDEIIAGNDGYFSVHYSGSHSYHVPKFDMPELPELSRQFAKIVVKPDGDENQLPSTVNIARQTIAVPLDMGEIPDFDFSGDTKIDEVRLFREGDLPVKGPVYNQPYKGDVASNGGKIEIDVNIPNEVKRINTIYLDPRPNGTEVSVLLKLNDLVTVSNGVVIDKIEVTLPARYKITESGNNVFTKSNIDIGTDAEHTELFHVESLDMSDLSPVDGRIHKIEDFSFRVDYTMSGKTGVINGFAPAPSVLVLGQPEFADASFTTSEIDFSLAQPYVHNINYTVEGFDGVVKSVRYAAFRSGANSFGVSVEDLGLPSSFQSELPISVTFPDSFDLAPDPNISGQVLTARLSEFQVAGGYKIALKGISFDTASSVPVDGKLHIDGAITVNIDHTFAEGKLITWSTDIKGKMVPDPINITIQDMALGIDYDNCQFELSGISQEITGGESFRQEFDIPDIIRTIDNTVIRVADNIGMLVQMKLSVEINNPITERFYLENFALQLPKFLVIANNPKVDADNVYRDPLVEINSGGATSFTKVLVDLQVGGLTNIGVNLNSAVAWVEGDFKFSAKARVDEGVSIAITDMEIVPKLEVSEIMVTALDGKLDFSLNQYSGAQIEPIDLSELLKELGKEQLRPDLAAPVIKVAVLNPVGISLLGDITLQPRDGSGEALEKIEIKGLEIGRANNQEPETTRLYITDNATQLAPAGYKPYNAPVSKLVKVIPHSIDMEVDVTANSALSHSVVFGEDYDFALEYSVDMPLSFGSDMNVVIERVVDRLGNTFTDLAKQRVKISDITACVELEVSFPLRFSDITAEFVDIEGASIPGLVTTVEGVIEGAVSGSGSGSGSGRKSKLSIKMKVPNGGDFQTLSTIEGLKLRIPITGTGAENRLHKDDYISGNVWLELEKGVSLNLDDL